MYLPIFIVLASILGFVLMSMGPLIGGILAFGLVFGSILYGLYQILKLKKKMDVLVPDKEKHVEAYEHYLQEQANGRDEHVT
ncbi:hypothetical protein ACSVDE_02925 [Pseudalkalibacillus sp. Hm43]|uniref:hypothetical protein n=1 Tax=Pseudalkalibacillus sp. Hm43 TaxID=3450742 RepID=UPI003F441496